MFYRMLDNEKGKNLFGMKKTGKEISEAQKNFYFFSSCPANEDGEMFKTIKSLTPAICYGCYIISQYLEYVNGHYLGRNGVMIYHVFFMDDKNIIKYAKLNSKYEVKDVQVLKEGEVKEFSDYAIHNSEAIAFFLDNVRSKFQEGIKNKIENEIVLTDKEKAEVASTFALKDEKMFTNMKGEIILENVNVKYECKSYAYSYWNSASTEYLVFRGHVKGFANNAKINVTFSSLCKSCNLLGIEWTGDKMIEFFNGKNWMFDGDFTLYGNTVIGRNVSLLCEIK